uniref:Galactosylgalactosylxylosylprotein 3-beta-glucuronosyltransferase n=1 Tax=Schistocephalus solidus TaxID=70667 RepID=A0A0X3PBN3_SCHSO
MRIKPFYFIVTLSLVFLLFLYGGGDFRRHTSKTIIFVITPTYYRLTQKPELIRLCSTFSLIPDLHWIIVEDSVKKTDLVTQFSMECKVHITQLFAASPKVSRPIKGSNQRNRGLQWILENVKPGELKGVVYFADDDNTYHPKVFEEILVWHTKTQKPKVSKESLSDPVPRGCNATAFRGSSV